MEALAYVRVSSHDQTEGTSLESQTDAVAAYAKLKGIPLAGLFKDAGVSGGTPLSERPAGSQLLEALGTGDARAVVIMKLDRMFRNTVDCLQTVGIWEKAGIALHIVDLGGNSIDSTSPAGRFMLTVLSAAAEMERGMIRDRCNAGRKARKAQGCRVGEVPFGYDLDPADDERKRLIANSQEQQVISDVLGLASNGMSLRAIAVRLNQNGIRTKKGKDWSHAQVGRLIRAV